MPLTQQQQAISLLEAGRKNVFIKNLYSSQAQYEAIATKWFDEGPAVAVKIVGVNTSSIDTKSIDQFRQGVEITQNKHTYGLVKILAGTPGHIIKPLCYGINEKTIISEESYVEVQKFDPIEYLEVQEAGLPLEDVFTFPIILNDSDQSQNYDFNGVIEPFSIRPIASFFSTEFPYPHRAFRGSLEGGNNDLFLLSNDQVLTVDYWNTSKNEAWYLDGFEMFDVSGSIKSSIGYVNDNLNKIANFDDSKVYVKTYGINETTSGQDMIDAILAMTSSLDNYIPPGKKSATCGFVFDRPGYAGTDSIAFGGLSY